MLSYQFCGGRGGEGEFLWISLSFKLVDESILFQCEIMIKELINFSEIIPSMRITYILHV